MSLREGAEKALNALECTGIDGTYLLHEEAIDALRTALAEADEPVAWRYKKDGSDKWHVSAMTPDEAREWNEIVAQEPLYTHPPRREPLAEEELFDIYDEGEWQVAIGDFRRIARAIERAHGIGGEAG